MVLVRSSIVACLLGFVVLVLLAACGRAPEPVGESPPAEVEPVTAEVGAEGGALELSDGVRLRVGAASGDASAHVTLARDGASVLSERGFVTGNVYAVSFDAVSGTLPESYLLEFTVAERIPGTAYEVVLYDGDERTVLEGSVDGDLVRVEVPLPASVAVAADGVARHSAGSQHVDLSEVLPVLVQYADSGAQEPVALRRDASGCVVDGDVYPVCFIAEDGSGRPFVASEDAISAVYFVAYDSDGKKIVSLAMAALPIVAVAAVTVKTGGGALLTGTKAVLAVSKTVASFLKMIDDLSALSEMVTRGINCYGGMCRTRDVANVRVDDTNMLTEVRVAFLGPEWCQAGTGCGWLNFHFTDAQDRVSHSRTYIWVRLSQEGSHLHRPKVYGFEFKSLEQALDGGHRDLTVGEFEFNTEYCPNGSSGGARSCGETKLEVLGIALVKDPPWWWFGLFGESQLVALHANVPGAGLPPVDEVPVEDIVRVSVRPTSATLAPGEQRSFEAIVSGSSDERVDWSVPASCGTISSTGLYTAPAHAASCTVTATSRADRSVAGTASVTVRHLAPVIDSYTASPARVAFGAQSTLSWSVQGAQPMQLSIDRGVGDVSTRSTTRVGPTTTTVYTLSASNAHGTATREVTVTVDEPTDGRPIARLVTDPAGQARLGQIVRLDASDSVFGSGSRLRYEFMTGDGRSRDQSGSVWSVSYGRVGTFEPCVRVRNTLGEVSEWVCQRLNVVDEPAGGADFVIDNYTSDQVSQWNFFGKSIDYGEGFTLRVTWYNDGDPLPDDHPEFETHVYADTELVARRVTGAGRLAGIDFAADRFRRFGHSLEPGTYTIVMIVNATNSVPEIDVSNNTASFILHVRSHSPTADFRFETECLTATFEDTSQHPSGAGRIARRVWSFDDGNSSTLTNPVHTFDEPGTYRVRLSVEDEWGNSDRRTRSVLVEACDQPAEPVAVLSFDAEPGSIVAGESTTLTWSVSGSQPISLEISPDVGDVSGESSVTISPSVATTYTLTASNSAGTDAATTTVSVSEVPVVSVNVEPSSVTLPVNGTQSFTATVTGASDTSVTWEASCGSISGSGDTVSYTAPGSPGSCLVRATSVADSQVVDQATVLVDEFGGSPPPAGPESFVAVGWGHSLAVREDGTVWAWGDGGYGQLGDGSAADRLTPVQVVGLSSARSAAAGSIHSLALREDGTVWAWGYGEFGQLGDGSTSLRVAPVQVVGLSNVRRVAAGSTHSLAVREDGTVWAWGRNLHGQLGDGSTTDRVAPVQVVGLSNVRSVAAGMDHSLAVREDGTVWAWGRNLHGELGDGSTTDRVAPVQVVGLSNVRSVAGWASHSLAVREDGTVWAWGLNGSGGLGDGTFENRSTPVQVVELSNVRSVAAGWGHSLAVREDGTVWAWGWNGSGQLGDGSDVQERTTPGQVVGLSNVESAAAGQHSLAAREDGSVWAWGRNNYGQLGDGSTTDRNTPVQVVGFASAQHLPHFTESTVVVEVRLDPSVGVNHRRWPARIL